MDRQIVYPGQVPLETDILNTNQYAMLGLAKLAGGIFGTSDTMVNGFACTPTTPASLKVNVGAGEVYALQAVDYTPYSSLSADTSHQVLKQGMLLDTTALTITPPTTTGQSINYLIQTAFVETDSGEKVLQYYNSANPAQSFSGAGNSGSVQPTVRQNTATLKLKSGASAPTGSQTTPTPDAGYVGLWVVTVATGQIAINSSHITTYANAPFINSGLLGLNPNFTVSPTAPTPPNGDKSKKVATMEALQAAIAGVGQPTGSYAQTGWERMPNGLIRQWGSRVVSGTGTRTDVFNLPIVFPNQCFQMQVTDVGAGCLPYGATANTYQATVYIPAYSTAYSASAQATGNVGYYWQAIGN